MKKALLNRAAKILGVIAVMLMTFQVHAVALQLQQSRSDMQLTCIELKDSRFELSFIHSVSLTQVFDSYVLHGEQIMQTEERFSAHGQGLPSLVDEPDATAFEHKDGLFILHLERPIKHLIVRTDRRFKNRLYTGKQVLNLNQWPDTGIYIKPIEHCP